MSHAFPIYDADLEVRAKGISVGSKTYRKSSQSHHYAYKLDPNTDTVSRKRISAKDRIKLGSKAIAVPKTDADHILEKQMVTKHLAKYGPAGQKSINNLPQAVQTKVRNIVNAPGNLAPISSSINRSKGGKTKAAIEGKANKPNKATESYMAVTYPTARRVAKQIDKVYKDHGIKTSQSVDKTLRNSYRAAGILKQGQKTPSASPGSSRPTTPVASGSKRKAVFVSPKKTGLSPSKKVTKRVRKRSIYY